MTLVAAGRPRFTPGALISMGSAVTGVAGNPIDGNADGIPGPSVVVVRV